MPRGRLASFGRAAALAWLSLTLPATSGAGAAAANDPGPGGAARPAHDAWRFLTFEQRHAEMTFLIHPALMERYQAFYRTEAPELRCATCHGEDMEAVRYRMADTPLDDLKPSAVQALYLDGAVLDAEQTFKRDVITPLMARLMGVPAYDPASGLGFSCFGCHPREAE